MQDVFPFTLHANDKGWSSITFRCEFLRVKPEKMIWYCYDVVVKSPTEVTFVVYDMRGNLGGIGDEIARIDAQVDAEITEKCIDNRIMSLARSMREVELDLLEREALARHAADIRAVEARRIAGVE